MRQWRVTHSVAALQRPRDRLLNQRIVLHGLARAEQRARRVATDAAEHVRR